jgi:hypothetical protein
MKRSFAFIIAAVMLFSFAACSKTIAYKDDVAVTVLSDAGVKKISHSSNLNTASDEFMMFFLNVDSSLYSECKVMTPMGSTSIDEFGIFKAASIEHVAKIEEALSSYLANRVATWDTRYSQEEKPKVDGAKVTIYGNYVIYTILSAEEQGAFLDAVKEILVK